LNLNRNALLLCILVSLYTTTIRYVWVIPLIESQSILFWSELSLNSNPTKLRGPLQIRNFGSSVFNLI